MFRRFDFAVPLLCAFAVLIGGPAAQAQRRVRTIPVNVESQPPGATVFVDDPASAPLGTTPLRNVRVPRGQHTLIFKLAGHEDATLQVNVRRRRETFRAELRPQSVIEVTSAHADTAGAAVRIDGEPVGNVRLRAVRRHRCPDGRRAPTVRGRLRRGARGPGSLRTFRLHLQVLT